MSDQEYWAIKSPEGTLFTSTDCKSELSAWCFAIEVKRNEYNLKEHTARSYASGLRQEGYRAVKVKIVEVEE